jgi:putative aldouronate transport system permease protein
MVLPALVAVGLFSYLPLFGYLCAFEDYRPTLGFFHSPWVGFRNFRFFFTSADFVRVTRNTLFLNLLFIATEQGTALILAICLNEIRSHLFKRVAQSVVLLPFFISWVVVSTMAAAVFSDREGALNGALRAAGFQTVAWYTRADLFPWLLTLLRIWKGAGFTSVIFLASMTSIPEDLYEAAKVDGAQRLQQIVRITIPLLIPTIAIMALLSLGRVFYGDFGMIYNIVRDNGLLFPTTDVIDTYVYRSIRTIGDFGLAGAVGLYQSFMGMILVLSFNWLARRVNPQARLF